MIATPESTDSPAMPPTPEDLHSKILVFLTKEFAREKNRQCIGLNLLYAPGEGYRDEYLRRWSREDEPELFDDLANIEKLVSQIMEIAQDEADAKPLGKHRFAVITQQHFGAHMKMSFALSPTYFGKDDEDWASRLKAKKASSNGAQTTVLDSHEPLPLVALDPRKHLLARMAGNIAAGVMSAPSKWVTGAQSVADISVDVAEAILKKIDL